MGSGWPERVHPNRSCTECSSSLKVRAHSSGKPMGDIQPGRALLLVGMPLQQLTKNTLTDHQALELEIETVKQQGYAFNDEEFLPGLVCLAVLSSSPSSASNIGVATPITPIRFRKVTTNSLNATIHRRQTTPVASAYSISLPRP